MVFSSVLVHILPSQMFRPFSSIGNVPGEVAKLDLVDLDGDTLSDDVHMLREICEKLLLLMFLDENVPRQHSMLPNAPANQTPEKKRAANAAAAKKKAKAAAKKTNANPKKTRTKAKKAGNAKQQNLDHSWVSAAIVNALSNFFCSLLGETATGIPGARGVRTFTGACLAPGRFDDLRCQ
jgi:hypothetical protein